MAWESSPESPASESFHHLSTDFTLLLATVSRMQMLFPQSRPPVLSCRLTPPACVHELGLNLKQDSTGLAESSRAFSLSILLPWPQANLIFLLFYHAAGGYGPGS